MKKPKHPAVQAQRAPKSADAKPNANPQPPKTDGAKTDGAKTDGAKIDGAKSEGKPAEVPPSIAPALAAPMAAAPSVAEAPAPQGVAEPTGEFEPVIHARDAKIDTCMDNIVAQSSRVIDRPHKAISTWVTQAPNDNVFQSIIGLTYPNKLAPNGAAIILASPIGPKKCEGESVQIYPTSQSCTALQATLIKIGHTVATLGNLPLIELKDGSRDLLMPTAGGGCVLVTVRLR